MTVIDNRPKRKWYKKLIKWMNNNSDLISPTLLISFTNILWCVVVAKTFELLSVNISECPKTFFAAWFLAACFSVWYLLSKIRDRD